MERETKTIETPVDKHKVVLKSWITGREKRDITLIFYEQGEGKEARMDRAKMIKEADDKAIETIVISIGGDTKNIVDRVLDMKLGDYNFVVSEINKVSRDKDFLG